MKKRNKKQPKKSEFFVHPSTLVEDNVEIGKGTKIWHQGHIRKGTKIGENCIIGRAVFIDFDSKLGNNIKVQNNAILYHQAIIEDGVFVGPGVILANDKLPRAINPDETLKSGDDWEVATTLIKKGAAIGASSVLTPGITIGAWSMAGSGSVITKDIPDHALIYGNPAKIKGFVCKCGKKLAKIGENEDVVVTRCACGEEVVIPKEIYRLKDDNQPKRKIWLR